MEKWDQTPHAQTAPHHSTTTSSHLLLKNQVASGGACYLCDTYLKK